MSQQLRDYIVFYDSKKTHLQAESLYDAKLKGIAYFKPPKSKQHLVSPVLADKTLSAQDLP